MPATSLAGDDFFDDSGFIGAVEGEDEDWTDGWTVGMPDGDVSFECPAGTTEIDPVDGNTRTCQLQGTYTSDLLLARGNIYTLDGTVFIGEDNASSATLTIDPGVYIAGETQFDYLVISRGSKIMAEGTNNMPITFSPCSHRA